MTKRIKLELTEDQATYLWNLINSNIHVQPYAGEEFAVRVQKLIGKELHKLAQAKS